MALGNVTGEECWCDAGEMTLGKSVGVARGKSVGVALGSVSGEEC